MSASSSGVGPRPASAPVGRDQARRDLVRADDAHALALEDRGEADEQAVVATAKQLRKLAGALDRAPVEPQVGEFRPGDRADHGQLAGAMPPQGGEQLADLPQPDPGVRIGLDGGVGHADDADHERLAPGLRGRRRRPRAETRRRRTGWRAAAAAAGPPLAGVHASSPFPSRGTQIARSPPARRKATICCTAS